MTLTGPQRQAVERVGQDVCVVAGPGSGKTRVLVERFRWRIEHGFSPRRMLAVTFTEKAATEIKQRLAEYFRSRPELREELERARVSTVHGFCAGLLREHAIEAGLDPQFEVLDESEALAELRAAAEEALDGLVAERPEAMRALLRAVDLADPVEQLSQVYEARRLTLPNTQPAPSPVAAPSGYADERALLEEALDRLDRRYAERKQALGALDFADLEEQAIRLLRSDERLRERVQASFDEVLMDELQDTNPLQAALINLVRRPGRFFAVGDINQSIYGFRHAEPEVFRRYRQELESQDAVIDRLEENHRSRADILAAVELILGGTEGLEPHELKAVGKFARREEPSVELIAALGVNTEEAAALEAQWVARRIRELEASGAWQFSDMAVLVRNVGALPALEEAFRDSGVPHLIVRGKGFYETQEVTDLIHCLRILANPRDEVSLAAVLRSPLVGISDETLLRLKERGNLGAALDGLQEQAIEPADHERLVLFRDRLRALRAESDDLAPDRLLTRAMDAANYESSLGPGARANVRKLLGQLRDSFHRRPRPLARLAEELELRRASDPREPMAPPEESANAVRLMTIHGAKGLEFPVVFLAALHKGVFRVPPALAFSPGAGLAVRWRDPATGEAIKDAVYTACLEELKRKQEAEEDRLFYVAMTRAKEHLVLSFAAGKGRAREWAKLLVERLGLDLKRVQETPAVRTYETGEKTLRARVLCTASPPERSVPRQVEPAGKPEQRARPPAVTGQHDSTVAVTSVWEYARCPRRYFLARYLGWEQPLSEPRPLGSGRRDDTELDAAELGRQVHNLLAGLPVKEPVPEALELAARFQASDLARRVASAARLEREFDFLIDLEGVLLEGRIDLWFEQSSELVLVDFKTDQVDAATAASHAASYALQLQLYALALERHFGRLPDQALIYLLRPNAAVAVSLDRQELEAARAALRALRQAQSEMSFPPQAGEHCYRCGYFRGMCPAARAAATR